MATEEYSQILSIDEHQLDKEWLAQPNLVFKFSKKQAAARKELESVKNRIEVVKADLDKAIRSAPEKFSISKVTEGAISAAIITQDPFKEAQAKLVEVKYKLDIYTAMVNALEHKKRALESLVTLHGQDYFSVPRAEGKGAQDFIENSKKKSVRKTL